MSCGCGHEGNMLLRECRSHMFPLKKIENCRGKVWANEAVSFYIGRKLAPLSLWNAALQCWPLLKMKHGEPIIRRSSGDLHNRKMRVVGFTYTVFSQAAVEASWHFSLILSCCSSPYLLPLKSWSSKSYVYFDLQKWVPSPKSCRDKLESVFFEASGIRKFVIFKIFENSKATPNKKPPDTCISTLLN